MARPRTPIGTFGDIHVEHAPGGRVRALARFRDHDGQLRRVQATADTPKAAEQKLKELLAERAEQSVGQGELTASSSFRHLVDVWLADLDLEDKLAPSTRALYERNTEKLVVPAFENYTLREITVRKVDEFIKTLSATKSYSTAKQAKTVLSLAFGLAVRYDALRENPVRDLARMRKPPSQAMALTMEQVDEIRAAVRGWRRGPGFAGASRRRGNRTRSRRSRLEWSRCRVSPRRSCESDPSSSRRRAPITCSSLVATTPR